MSSAEQILAKSIGVPFQISQVDTGRHRINYLQAGSGRPLLLLHGANVGWGQWHENIAALAAHYTVYALDLPGTGGTTRHDYRQLKVDQDYVGAVKQFIVAKHLGPLVVVAHSFGAVIALKLALDPETGINKLVLVGPLGFSDYINPKHRIAGIRPMANLIAHTAMSPSKPNMKKFLTETLHRKDTVNDDFLNYFHFSISSDKRSHPLLFMNSLTRRFKIKPEATVVDRLAEITQPTLIISGEHDFIVPLEKIADAIKLLPNVRVKVIPDTGHVPNQEHPDLFNRTVIDFLRSGHS